MMTTEDLLREQVVIQFHDDVNLWDWETDAHCCEELGFETEAEARADFEEFLKESARERGEWV